MTHDGCQPAGRACVTSGMAVAGTLPWQRDTACCCGHLHPCALCCRHGRCRWDEPAADAAAPPTATATRTGAGKRAWAGVGAGNACPAPAYGQPSGQAQQPSFAQAGSGMPNLQIGSALWAQALARGQGAWVVAATRVDCLPARRPPRCLCDAFSLLKAPTASPCLGCGGETTACVLSPRRHSAAHGCATQHLPNLQSSS